MKLLIGPQRSLLVAQARTYYVDATGGNDSNTGRSADLAWKTIGKVNASTFEPGDRVLFKRGETWTGTTLIIPSSGVADNPITFADYGSGDKPVIDGNDTVNCIRVNAQSCLIFRNIRCVSGLNKCFNLLASAQIYLYGCEAEGAGNDNLCIDTGTHDVIVSGGDFSNVYERVGGTTNANITISDNVHSILIQNTTCYGGVTTSCHGITIHNHPGTVYAQNITIRDCTLHNNAGSGIYMMRNDAGATSDRNILVERTQSYSNKVGVYIGTLAATYIQGVTFQFCTFSAATLRNVHLAGDNVTFENCVIINTLNTAALPVYVTGAVNARFYNSTFYATSAVTAYVYMMYVDGARTNGFEFKNNILEAESANPYMFRVSAGTGITDMSINYNLYGYTGAGTLWQWLGSWYNWSNWKANSGQDANSPTPADPLFTDAVSSDFTLQTGSPAINAGVDVGLDYLGNAPDCGAYEKA